MDTTNTLLEKREYSPGDVRYVPAASYQPGVSYYVQRKDEEGRDYYLNTTPQNNAPQMYPSNVPMQAYSQPFYAPVNQPYPQTMVSQPYPLQQQQQQQQMTVTPPSYPGSYPQQVYQQPDVVYVPGEVNADGGGNVNFGGLACGHVIVSLLSLCIPFFYLVAYPILYGVLRSFLKEKNLLDNDHYRPKFSSYGSLGWTIFVFILIGHFFMVVSWPLTSTYTCYNSGYGGFGGGGYNCYTERNSVAFGFAITGSVISGIAWILTVCLAGSGCSWIKA
jgi:hypothetical protein